MSKLTEEQIVFAQGIGRLKMLHAMNRPLTDEEADEEDLIKSVLFQKVVKYGMKLANQMMSTSNLASDAYADVQQELAMIFYQKLENYDPMRTTPTTYFKKYFQEVIRNYLLSYSQNLSQYDASNLKRVREAISYYESLGVKPDEELLSNRTGLSKKVIRTTLYNGHNSKRADIEEAIWLKSSIPTPEEAVEETERKQLLYEALTRDLSTDDLKLVILRLNVNGPKEMPYERISKITGIPIRTVKIRLNNAFRVLNQDRELVAKFGDYNKRDEYLNFKYMTHEDPSSIIEEQLEDDLDSFFDNLFD